MPLRSVLAVTTVLYCSLATAAHAQDTYEIQVYGSETVAPGHTTVELHSNCTIDGSKSVVDGVTLTSHALHETVEIAQGSMTGSKPAFTFSPVTTNTAMAMAG
jgi:hypothetical protein